MEHLKITIEGVEGAEVARRLAAALEQYGTQPQVKALRAELDRVRAQLHREQNETTWAAAYIVGDPVPPRVPGKPCSLIESVAIEVRKQLTDARQELAVAANIIEYRQMVAPGQPPHHTGLLNEIAGLVDRDVRREIGADHAETKQQLAVALDRIHQLEQVHDRQVVALKATRDQVWTLQRESTAQQAATLEAIAMMEGRRTVLLNQTEVNNKLLREVSELMRALESNSGSDRVRKELAEAHERICKQNDIILALDVGLRKSRNVVHFVDDEARKVREALGLGSLAQVPEVLAAIEDLRNDARLSESRAEVIKHLHEEYHQMQARKMGAEFDLERAKEEIAFAEAETAKYKPLIEAVRAAGLRGGAVFIAAGHWVELSEWATTATDGKQYTRVKLSGSYLLGGLKCL